MGGGPISIGSILGAFVGFGLYFVVHHGIFDVNQCLGACWVEVPGWIAIGGLIGGFVNSIYDEYQRNKR